NGACIARNRVHERPVAAVEVHVLIGRRLVRKLGSRRTGSWCSHGKPSLSAHPLPPASPARRLGCGNARTAALPARETSPIDAALMDIATPTPGRLNRATRLRVMRERAHYIHSRDMQMTTAAPFGSTSKRGQR